MRKEGEKDLGVVLRERVDVARVVCLPEQILRHKEGRHRQKEEPDVFHRVIFQRRGPNARVPEVHVDKVARVDHRDAKGRVRVDGGPVLGLEPIVEYSTNDSNSNQKSVILNQIGANEVEKDGEGALLHALLEVVGLVAREVLRRLFVGGVEKGFDLSDGDVDRSLTLSVSDVDVGAAVLEEVLEGDGLVLFGGDMQRSVSEVVLRVRIETRRDQKVNDIQVATFRGPMKGRVTFK